MQNRIAHYLAGLVCFFATTLRTDAHAFMVRAEPRVGSSVEKAPTEVRIWFSETVQPSMSRIQVFDVRGNQVDKKDTHFDRGNRAVLDVSLVADLAPGTYKVLWRVTSTDTHITSGDFHFQIVP